MLPKTDRHTDTQTGRQADRHTDRQTHRQAGMRRRVPSVQSHVIHLSQFCSCSAADLSFEMICRSTHAQNKKKTKKNPCQSEAFHGRVCRQLFRKLLFPIQLKGHSKAAASKDGRLRNEVNVQHFCQRADGPNTSELRALKKKKKALMNTESSPPDLGVTSPLLERPLWMNGM